MYSTGRWRIIWLIIFLMFPRNTFPTVLWIFFCRSLLSAPFTGFCYSSLHHSQKPCLYAPRYFDPSFFFYLLMSIESLFFLRQSLVVFAFKNSLFSFSISSFIFPIKSPYKTGKFFFCYSFNSLLNIMVLSVICHLLIWVLKLVLMA